LVIIVSTHDVRFYR